MATAMQALRRSVPKAARLSAKGQEAIRASALLTLRPGDLVCDLSGSDAGRTLGLPPLWVDPPTGTPHESLTLLLGAACALRAQRTSSVVPLLLVFVAAPFLTRPQWRASLALAARNSLPLLLQVLPSPPPSLAGALSAGSQTDGVPGIPVDSADAVALCRVLSEASLRARNGDGPTLIEAVPWLLPNTPTQTPQNPLQRLQITLKKRGLAP